MKQYVQYNKCVFVLKDVKSLVHNGYLYVGDFYFSFHTSFS